MLFLFLQNIDIVLILETRLCGNIRLHINYF